MIQKYAMRVIPKKKKKKKKSQKEKKSVIQT